MHALCFPLFICLLLDSIEFSVYSRRRFYQIITVTNSFTCSTCDDGDDVEATFVVVGTLLMVATPGTTFSGTLVATFGTLFVAFTWMTSLVDLRDGNTTLIFLEQIEPISLTTLDEHKSRWDAIARRDGTRPIVRLFVYSCAKML